MSMTGKMSTGMLRMASQPMSTSTKDMTAIVYGCRSARRTIHIAGSAKRRLKADGGRHRIGAQSCILVRLCYTPHQEHTNGKCGISPYQSSYGIQPPPHPGFSGDR